MTPDVLLVQMPFGLVHRPNIGLALLEACIERAGFGCRTLYLNNDFAALIGRSLYDQIADQLPQQRLIGELLFATAAFGPREYGPAMAAIVAALPRHIRDSLPLLLQAVDYFLDFQCRSIDWSAVKLVGFANMFQQNTPVLALARRLAQMPERPRIIVGGANCEAEMGQVLHRNFPWLDFVCQGEGEQVIVELLEVLRDGGGPDGLARIHGLIWRDGETSVVNPSRALAVDLDSLPTPSYQDWLRQLARHDLPVDPSTLMLPIETARGCWYGAKSHCTFCGLNGESMAFRSKSPSRVLAEVEELGRYGIPTLFSVDNILDHKYFKTLLPQLAAANHGLRFFFEIKSNVTREQVELLHDSGIVMIQPGIESLSTHVLKLMRKGVTGVQNIRLLKWSAEYGIDVLWHLLYGFPREQPEAYAEMAGFMPSLVHLQPPRFGCIEVFLERFSPMYRDPAGHGLTRVRPSKAYAAVFPLSPEELSGLAYYFDADFIEPQNPGAYIAPVREIVDLWRQLAGRVVFQSHDRDERVHLHDTRPGTEPCNAHVTLDGLERTIFQVCSDGRTRQRVHELVQAPGERIDAILERFIELRWVLDLDGQLLGLATSTTPRVRHEFQRKHQPSKLPVYAASGT